MSIYQSNAQDCLHKLCDELLGEDYYIVSPVSGNQANEIITNRIIELYKPKESPKRGLRRLLNLIEDVRMKG